MGKYIKIGGILSNYIIKGPNLNELVFKRCKYLLMKPKKKKNRKDFGHLILQLPEEVVTKQEFELFFKNKKVKLLDKDLLTELMNRFIVRKTRVDCIAMRQAYMELYPDTTLPPPKPKKKKKGRKKSKGKKKKITETEIAVHDLENQQEVKNTVKAASEKTSTETIGEKIPMSGTTEIPGMEPYDSESPTTELTGTEIPITEPEESEIPSTEPQESAIPNTEPPGTEIPITESRGIEIPGPEPSDSDVLSTQPVNKDIFNAEPASIEIPSADTDVK